MKKITALFLAVILAVAVALPVLADDAAEFTIDSATIEAGQTANLTVSITANPGIAGGTITLTAASPLTISNIKKAKPSLFSGFQAAKNIVFDEDGNVTDTGAFCTFDVTVPEGTAAGQYEISIIFREVINEDYEDVDCTVVKGIVTVPGAPTPAVEVNMSATPKDGAEVGVNFYVTGVDAAEADAYSFIINNVATSLADVTADANGYKITVPMAAKKMGDTISVSLVKEGENDPIYSAETSVKAYAEALIAGEFSKEVKDVASAMLAYGAAAQVYFNYNTDALVADAEIAATVAGAKFDNVPMIWALVGAPVKYTAMSVSCLSDITLSLAFQVIDGEAEDALAWVQQNMTIGGDAVNATLKTGNNGTYKYVIVDVTGITLDEVLDEMAIEVAGADAGSVSVLNYLYAVEEAYANNPAKAGIVNLVRGLYAYASAIEALA
jgi:hypothetical protein